MDKQLFLYYKHPQQNVYLMSNVAPNPYYSLNTDWTRSLQQCYTSRNVRVQTIPSPVNNTLFQIRYACCVLAIHRNHHHCIALSWWYSCCCCYYYYFLFYSSVIFVLDMLTSFRLERNKWRNTRLQLWMTNQQKCENFGSSILITCM